MQYLYHKLVKNFVNSMQNEDLGVYEKKNYTSHLSFNNFDIKVHKEFCKNFLKQRKKTKLEIIVNNYLLQSILQQMVTKP